MTEKSTTWVKTELPIHYRSRVPQNPKALAVFLHGFTDHGGSMMKRLFPSSWPESLKDVAWIAPNGPFPVPVKSDDGWKDAFSWYFYDERTETMVIPPDTAVHGIAAIIEKELPHFAASTHTSDPDGPALPVFLIGFSQGGFLAPAIAAAMNRSLNLKVTPVEIIALGTGFRLDYYSKLVPLTVTAVHGESDSVFPIRQAQTNFTLALKTRDHTGAFVTLPNTAHTVTPAMGEIVRQRLEGFLSRETSP